jgi:hypothetical protein
MWFKHHAVMEFLIAKKVPPIDIHHHMQAVYGDKCVDVGYGSLSKQNWGKQVCVAKQGRWGQ